MKKLFYIFIILFDVIPVIADTITCGTSLTNYFAIYTINTYTCQNGEYLPANTEECHPCPPGYTCNGGTFGFNPNIYQGAVFNSITTTTTMNNVCADNFPINLYAIFEPNTVTLTYDDGTGNTTSGTCTYNDLITLPPEPTRPGYTFTGWKLQTNQQP